MATNIYTITIKTTDAIKQEIENTLSQNFPGLSFDTATIESNFSEILQLYKQESQDNLLRVKKALNILTASGVELDILARNLGAPKRKAGSSTIQEVDIVINDNITLYGKDQTEEIVFTITDTANNNYLLQNTTSLTAGADSLIFISEKQDTIISPIGSLKIITSVPEVSSVSNSKQPISIGSAEEFDAPYRERIFKSIQVNTEGTDEAIESQLLIFNDITDVKVINNRLTVSLNEIPPKTFYVIVEGGTDDEIISVLYNNTAVVDFYGSIVKEYITSNGNSVVFKWDNPESINLYLKFNIKAKNSSQTIDEDVLTALKEKIVENISFKIGEEVDTLFIDAEVIYKSLSSLNIQAYINNTLISLDNINWSNLLKPPLFKNKFSLIANNINISIL